ncbi:TonB family protein [uncultured Porphyromonas sp.]|uniref:energy transducer TonB family protein n=1 Tax=uncultured Porphyromonas sp. TaxID=159274 RepID=UPI0028048618|nr:TonB family protein [uncultured Porphyromonas sp.]
MSKVRYDRWIAGGVALLLHLLVVGLLFWLSMDASEQKHTRDKEIWISVGVDPDFGDKIEHQGDLVAAASTSARPASAASESAQAAPPQQPAPKAPEATPTPHPTPTPARATPTKEKPKAVQKPTAPSERDVDNKVAGLFDRKKPTGAESGTGKSDAGSGVADKGRAGSSAGWSLDGRSIVGNGGRPVMPTRVPDIRGTVVVEITVNAAGQVIDAKVRLRGTNVVDSALREAAVKAARKTRFNALGGVPDQKGTITYHFDVKG